MRPPSDWSPRTQTGAGYDLSVGEGRRVWQECLAAAALDAEQLGAPARAPSTGQRYGAPTLHRPRLGQGIFRVQVLDAYGRACAVTGEPDDDTVGHGIAFTRPDVSTTRW